MFPARASAPAARNGPVRPSRRRVSATPRVTARRDSRVLIGTTESSGYVEVRARVSGFLKSVDFVPGDFVKAEQMLFHIEPDQFDASVDVAKAQVAIQQAELARAEADLERVNKAVQTNAVSEQEVGLAQADRDKASGSLDAARSDLRLAELNLGYTKVASPIAGKVSRNLVSVGNLVGASGQTTLLTTVAALQPIYVYFDVPECFVVKFLRKHSAQPQTPQEMKSRNPISVALETDEGFPHQGWIDFLDNQVNKSTGTITLRAVLPNKELKVYPGLFARVRVPGEPLPDAVVVEATAIGTDLGGKYVFVVGEDNIVARKYVKLGEEMDGQRVVLEGLDKDTDYIVEGMIRARPGLPVNPKTREEHTQAKQAMKAQQTHKQGG